MVEIVVAVLFVVLTVSFESIGVDKDPSNVAAVPEMLLMLEYIFLSEVPVSWMDGTADPSETKTLEIVFCVEEAIRIPAVPDGAT